MTRLRPLLACLLSLILVVGSVAAAVARHEMAGVTDVTLCSTDGTVAVEQFDAAGNPVAMAHDCPHCLAASALGLLAAAPGLTRPSLLVSGRVLPGLASALPPAQTLSPLARGPPLPV